MLNNNRTNRGDGKGQVYPGLLSLAGFNLALAIRSTVCIQLHLLYVSIVRGWVYPGSLNLVIDVKEVHTGIAEVNRQVEYNKECDNKKMLPDLSSRVIKCHANAFLNT